MTLALSPTDRQPWAAPPAVREFGYWLHRYRRTWRGTIVISVANPLLFLTAMGLGLGKLVNHGHSSYLHGATYLAFVAPGLLAAGALQSAATEAGGPVYQSARQRGNYRAAAATPMSPTDIQLGHLLFMAFRTTLSATAFTAVITAFGIVGPLTGLLLIPATLLTGMALSAPMSAWAVSVTKPAKLNATFRFLIMPMYMFSGTFYPIAQLPVWLRDIIAVTPLYQGIQLCRSLVLNTVTIGGTLTSVLYLTVLTTFGYLAGRRSYRRCLHS